MRRLASHLVRDPDEADDLIQETRRRVLELPTPLGIDLRYLLARVMRTLARDRSRESEMRHWHEKAASREEAWSPEEIEAGVALQRQLAEAVHQLEEPYRSAITLHYLEGIRTDMIAKRLGSSSSHVRMHIARGREMLRARLDRQYHGDRDSWSIPAVALIAERPRSEASAAQLQSRAPDDKRVNRAPNSESDSPAQSTSLTSSVDPISLARAQELVVNARARHHKAMGRRALSKVVVSFVLLVVVSMIASLGKTGRYASPLTPRSSIAVVGALVGCSVAVLLMDYFNQRKNLVIIRWSVLVAVGLLLYESFLCMRTLFST